MRGALPQGLAVDKLVEADVILGCTDQQHSRLALSDLVVRYLVPAIDCGVSLEEARESFAARLYSYCAGCQRTRARCAEGSLTHVESRRNSCPSRNESLVVRRPRQPIGGQTG